MKVKVSFNQSAYEVNIQSLQMNITKLIKCLDAIEVITGNRTIISLAEIENYITEKTTFKNVLLSATLLEVSDEYRYLEANLSKINYEVIEYKDNVPTTKESVLKQVKESHTEYLKDEFVPEYEILKNASEILNKLSNPSLVNCLKSDYNGKYSVNLLQLNNADRL